MGGPLLSLSAPTFGLPLSATATHDCAAAPTLALSKKPTTKHTTFSFHHTNPVTHPSSLPVSSSLPTLCCLFAPQKHTHTLSLPNSPNFQIEHQLPPSSWFSLLFLLPHFHSPPQIFVGWLSLLLLLTALWAGFCVGRKKRKSLRLLQWGSFPSSCLLSGWCSSSSLLLFSHLLMEPGSLRRWHRFLVLPCLLPRGLGMLL